jgi:hypothetical protein
MSTVPALINALAPHQGADRGITARELAMQLAVRPRRLRKLISMARTDGIAICGTPSTGYYVPRTAEELDQACRFLQNRALHSLRLMSVMKRVALPTLLGQLLLAQG